MQRLVNVSKELSVIAEMINDHSAIWQVTPDRVDVLSRHKTRLGPGHRRAIDELLKVAKGGARFWNVKVEHQAALLSLSQFYQRPTKDEIERVLVVLRTGSMRDGVADATWVKDTLVLLERLLAHDPGRPGGLDGQNEDTSVYMSPV